MKEDEFKKFVNSDKVEYRRFGNNDTYFYFWIECYAIKDFIDIIDFEGELDNISLSDDGSIGLSAKMICDKCGFRLDYVFNNNNIHK